MSDAEFGRLTFRQLDAMIRYAENLEKRWDARIALLASLVHNQWVETKDRLTPEDFMPKSEAAADPRNVKRMTVEEFAKFLGSMHVAMGGNPEDFNKVN